jgi:hypothetical protein
MCVIRCHLHFPRGALCELGEIGDASISKGESGSAARPAENFERKGKEEHDSETIE